MLGAHVSSTRPISRVIYDATSLGLETFQVFIRNNRSCQRRTFNPYEIADFNREIFNLKTPEFVVHGPYTMNLATSDELRAGKYTNIIESDLQLLSHFAGKISLVVHPGSATDCSYTEAIQNVAKLLRPLCLKYPGITIAVETMAGAGRQILRNPNECLTLMGMCSDVPNIKLCFDTCHVYASGSDLTQAWSLLKDYVAVVHVNNSVYGAGTCKDRHASLSSGKILKDDLCNFVKQVDSFNHNLPCILETPEVGVLDDISILKPLLQ